MTQSILESQEPGERRPRGGWSWVSAMVRAPVLISQRQGKVRWPSRLRKDSGACPQTLYGGGGGGGEAISKTL